MNGMSKCICAFVSVLRFPSSWISEVIILISFLCIAFTVCHIFLGQSSKQQPHWGKYSIQFASHLAKPVCGTYLCNTICSNKLCKMTWVCTFAVFFQTTSSLEAFQPLYPHWPNWLTCEFTASSIYMLNSNDVNFMQVYLNESELSPFRSLNDNLLTGEIPDAFQSLQKLINL